MTTANPPSDYVWAEIEERLPSLVARFPGIAVRRDGGQALGQIGAATVWAVLERYPRVALGLDPALERDRDRIAALLTCLIDCSVEVESLSTALVTSYSDMAVLDELGRSLPTCTDAEAVARLLGRLVAVRQGGMGALLSRAADGRWHHLAAWGGAAATVVDHAELESFAGRQTARIIDAGPLPCNLVGAGKSARGALCAVPLPGPLRLEGVLLLGRTTPPPFTSHDAKLLEVMGAQVGAYLHSLAQAAELRQAELLDHEIRLAGTIQQSLLPQASASIPGIDLAGSLTTARRVGGDYYDWSWDGCLLTLVVADVSGHNVAAALAMAMVRTALRTVLGQGLAPGEALTAVNHQLSLDLINARIFVSLVLVFVDPVSGEFTLANAGHAPVLRRDRHGRIHRHSAEGPVLGLFEEARFEEHTAVLDDGDALLLYTDGLVEARDAAGRVFGDDALAATWATAGDEPAMAVRALLAAGAAHRDGDQDDDITLLAIRRHE